jgi:hypothetical protein
VTISGAPDQHAATETITRNLIVLRLGTPDVTIGSVNEPREREEHGLRFNEKWIYRNASKDPARPLQRHLYWERYDFVASLLVSADGQVTREDIQSLLRGLSDRLFRPQHVPPQL